MVRYWAHNPGTDNACAGSNPAPVTNVCVKVIRKRIKETVKLTNLITFAIFVIVSYICIKELVLMDKNYVRYLKESTRKIQARIAGGNWQFGDHRRLKEQLAELAKYGK